MPIARLALAALLLVMALGQVLSVGAFVSALQSYRIGGRGTSTVVATALVASEAAAGVGLLTGRWPRVRVGAGWLGLGVAMIWAALAVQAFVRKLVIPNCGCFGRYLPQRLSWWILVQDGYFVLLALLALRSARRDAAGRRDAASGIPPVAGGFPVRNRQRSHE